jgi:hypothetical protein
VLVRLIGGPLDGAATTLPIAGSRRITVGYSAAGRVGLVGREAALVWLPGSDPRAERAYHRAAYVRDADTATPGRLVYRFEAANDPAED